MPFYVSKSRQACHSRSKISLLCTKQGKRISSVAMEYELNLTGLAQGRKQKLALNSKDPRLVLGLAVNPTLSFWFLDRLWASPCCPNEQEDPWGSDKSPWKVAMAVFPAE